MATHRQPKSFTESTSYMERHDIWQQLVDVAMKHIKLGQALQSQGVELLREVRNQRDNDDESSVRLFYLASTAIDRGVKIERDAYDKLAKLQLEKPREI